MEVASFQVVSVVKIWFRNELNQQCFVGLEACDSEPLDSQALPFDGCLYEKRKHKVICGRHVERSVPAARPNEMIIVPVLMCLYGRLKGLTIGHY